MLSEAYRSSVKQRLFNCSCWSVQTESAEQSHALPSIQVDYKEVCQRFYRQERSLIQFQNGRYNFKLEVITFSFRKKNFY